MKIRIFKIGQVLDIHVLRYSALDKLLKKYYFRNCR